jgi:glyoxylase-like metal-dependent hydrolase (beta-lactamase superfamily II)
MTTTTLAPGIRYTDLLFQDRPHVIATAILRDAGGVALVDPGPASTLPRLRASLEAQGIGIADLDTLVLTHIHLDHAGATGSLVRENPGLTVFVHERGAKHLIDPSRLLESAARLYGEGMDRLWGEVAPVPEANVRSLSGGERVRAGGRDLEVAYTPGHASHHVSYLDRASGIAFAGDTAGIKIGGAGFVLPPTPPPDIDLDAWKASVAALERWNPETLFLTHFGPASSVRPHLQALLDQLEAVAGMVRRSLAEGSTDEERFASFAAAFGVHLRRHVQESEAALYERAAPLLYNWQGLARYWRKREV